MAIVENYLAGLDDERCQLPNKKSDNPLVWDYAPDMYENPAL